MIEHNHTEKRPRYALSRKEVDRLDRAYARIRRTIRALDEATARYEQLELELEAS